jgi:hypothetical protein
MSMIDNKMCPYMTNISLTAIDKKVSMSFPVEVVSVVKIGLDNMKRFNEMDGVYILVTESGKRFVGTTLGFYSKLRNHKILKENKVKFLILCRTKDRSDANILSAWLIKRMGKLLNSKQPDLDRLMAIKYANRSIPEEILHSEIQTNFGIDEIKYLLLREPANIDTFEELMAYSEQEDLKEYLINFRCR